MSFELSLTIILGMIFVSNVLSKVSQSIISLQLALGLISILLFSLGLDIHIVENSKLINIGFIAFNVLIVNSGTQIDLKILKKEKDKVLLLVLAYIFLLVVFYLCNRIFQSKLWFIAAGPVVGGGATAAIASLLVKKGMPYLSVFPWMLFMFQSLPAVLISKWMINKYEGLASTYLVKKSKIPQVLKTPAYYLFILMLMTLLNIGLHSLFHWSFHLSITALLMGCLAGILGIIESNPLKSSDSLGLLMIGLMSLFLQTIAYTPFIDFFKLLQGTMIILLVTIGVFIGIAYLYSKSNHQFVENALLLMSCLIGFPLWFALIRNSRSKERLAQLAILGQMVISNGLSIIATVILLS